MKKIVFALFFVFLAAAAHAADSDAPPPDYTGQTAERPTLKKGERWDFKRKDKVLGYEFVEEKDGELTFLVGWEGQKRGKETRTQDLNFVKGYYETCSPYRGHLRFPLYVGKKWNYSHTSSKADQHGGTGESAQIDSRVKVVAYEQVTVPAGTFWAFRIEENRVTRGGTSYKAKLGYNATYWYSPEVKYTIKSEEENDLWNMELLRYTPVR